MNSRFDQILVYVQIILPSRYTSSRPALKRLSFLFYVREACVITIVIIGHKIMYTLRSRLNSNLSFINKKRHFFKQHHTYSLFKFGL